MKQYIQAGVMGVMFITFVPLTASLFDLTPGVNPDVLALPAPTMLAEPIKKAPIKLENKQNIGLLAWLGQKTGLIPAYYYTKSLAITHPKKFVAGAAALVLGLGYLTKKAYDKIKRSKMSPAQLEALKAQERAAAEAQARKAAQEQARKAELARKKAEERAFQAAQEQARRTELARKKAEDARIAAEQKAAAEEARKRAAAAKAKEQFERAERLAQAARAQKNQAGKKVNVAIVAESSSGKTMVIAGNEAWNKYMDLALDAKKHWRRKR